jgi:uncharacterized membrane protein
MARDLWDISYNIQMEPMIPNITTKMINLYTATMVAHTTTRITAIYMAPIVPYITSRIMHLYIAPAVAFIMTKPVTIPSHAQLTQSMCSPCPAKTVFITAHEMIRSCPAHEQTSS